LTKLTSSRQIETQSRRPASRPRTTSRKSPSALVLAAVAFAVGSASAIQTVPASGSWRGWTASLSGDRKHWALVSPDGSERGILHGDPWGTDVSAVIVRTDGDRLAIDATEYLAAGADRKPNTNADEDRSEDRRKQRMLRDLRADRRKLLENCIKQRKAAACDDGIADKFFAERAPAEQIARGIQDQPGNRRREI
jgi:hypothetical protein